MNTKADILSKKNQIDTTDDNKNVQVLKNEIWTRQVVIEAKLMIIKRNQVVEETILLDEIKRN